MATEREQALATSCPTCGASPGEPCRVVDSGVVRRAVHTERARPIREAAAAARRARRQRGVR